MIVACTSPFRIRGKIGKNRKRGKIKNKLKK
jgi:hypothetical protein